MREYTDLSSGWKVYAEDTVNNVKYEESTAKLPFIHKAEELTVITLTNSWTVPEKHDGETVYIEFRQVSGLTDVYCNGELLGSHATVSTLFRFKLTEEAKAGETFDIQADVSPFARPDGFFIFGQVRILTVSKSHFELDDHSSSGVFITADTSKPAAAVHIRSKITNPNNYDVISFTVTDAAGEVVASATQKPTGEETVLEIADPQYWGGQKDAHMYTLKAALVRDTTILDSLEIPFGIKELTISEDRFLRLNGLKLPLNGIELSNCRSIKTDKVLFDLMDANSIITGMIPSKTDLLAAADKSGTVFWYDLPYTGTDRDMDELREFLRQNYNHPSLSFVCCSGFADEAYVRRFKKICKEEGPGVFTAMQFDLKSAEFLPKELPDVVAITIKGKDPDDNFMEIRSRFDEIKKTNTETSFALFAYAPKIGENIVEYADAEESAAKISENALCAWHERLWNTFCREKSVIGFFAGVLTDAPEHPDTMGLISADREYIRDVFWFYKSQFSANEFVKICAADLLQTDKKKIDIKCYTNTQPLRILVNGETKKKYVPEEVYDGVYVFRKIALKNRTNIIEVSSGDQFDRAEIRYGK